MIQRIVKSIAIAFQVSFIGFKRAFYNGETKESILGYVDCLTKLPNRMAFERDKEGVYTGLSMVMVDIDNLKNLNDTRGHYYGDKIIQRLASTLGDAAGPMGRVYRYAGDEFICLVPREEVKSFCGEIRGNAKKEDAFTISQGVILDLDKENLSDSLVLADITMYRSKKRGKNQITIAPQFIMRDDVKVPSFKEQMVRQMA